MEMNASDEKIAELRGRIDEIDRQLVRLFEERLDIAREIGCLKRERNLGIKNEYRELEVRANCRQNVQNKAYQSYAESMMKCIMGASRGVQNADAPDYDDPWKYKYLELKIDNQGL